MNFRDNEKITALVTELQRRSENKGIILSNDDAQSELQDALLEYYNDRHFTPTDEKPYEDIYEGIILQLAMSSILKWGAEGETRHDEGGISRIYDSASNYPLKLTQKIIPLAKGVDR